MHEMPLRTVIFLCFVLLVVGGTHFYVWARLIRDTRLPPRWRRLATGLLVAAGVNIPLSMFLARNVSAGGAGPSLVVGLGWLGTLWFLFASLVTLDLVRAVARFATRHMSRQTADPRRRAVLQRLAGASAVAAGGGASIAALVEAGRLTTQRVEVHLPRLPSGLDGLRIAQLSDVHIGPTIGREFIREVVARVNELEPDLVAITGDLVDGSVEGLRDAVAPLGKITSRFGTFFVTGNHEYYSGADEWCEHLGSLGIRVLRNENVMLGPEGAGLCLAGVDDYHADRFGGDSNLGTALKGRASGQPVVLLAHQPRSAFDASDLDVDFQLSGHTHGGQLWPFNWLVQLQQPVIAGLERVGRTLVYVSRGTGYWGPPMRLGAPAEVTLVTLRSKAA